MYDQVYHLEHSRGVNSWPNSVQGNPYMKENFEEWGKMHNEFENIFLYSPLSNFLTNIESMKSNIIEIATIKIVFIILFILYFYH